MKAELRDMPNREQGGQANWRKDHRACGGKSDNIPLGQGKTSRGAARKDIMNLGRREKKKANQLVSSLKKKRGEERMKFLVAGDQTDQPIAL